MMIENDLSEIKQNLKEIDSAISLILKEIGHLKEKVDSIDSAVGDTSSSLGGMIDDSIGNITEMLRREEIGGIGDIVGKRDFVNNMKEILEKYKPQE